MDAFNKSILVTELKYILFSELREAAEVEE